MRELITLSSLFSTFSSASLKTFLKFGHDELRQTKNVTRLHVKFNHFQLKRLSRKLNITTSKFCSVNFPKKYQSHEFNFLLIYFVTYIQTWHTFCEKSKTSWMRITNFFRERKKNTQMNFQRSSFIKFRKLECNNFTICRFFITKKQKVIFYLFFFPFFVFSTELLNSWNKCWEKFNSIFWWLIYQRQRGFFINTQYQNELYCVKLIWYFHRNFSEIDLYRIDVSLVVFS